MKINIYQINQDRDTQRLKFMGLDAVRKVLRSAEPDCAAYDKVYSGDVKCRNLEDVFVLFQSGRPEGFQGHSLSVSDVVEVEDAASITPGFYFCDNIGFKEIPFQPELANDVVQSPTIQVVLVEPGKLARIAEVGTTLDAMQRTVGGDIEAYYPFEEQVCIVATRKENQRSPLNRAIRDADARRNCGYYRRYFLHLRLQWRILRQPFLGAAEAVSGKIPSPRTVLPFKRRY